MVKDARDFGPREGDDALVTVYAKLLDFRKNAIAIEVGGSEILLDRNMVHKIDRPEWVIRNGDVYVHEGQFFIHVERERDWPYGGPDPDGPLVAYSPQHGHLPLDDERVQAATKPEYLMNRQYEAENDNMFKNWDVF